jgi:hypothetical protein
MEDVTFVKNRTFKKISNICFLNALYLTDSYQITILINTLNVGTVNLNEKNMMFNWPLAKFLVQNLKSVSIYYKVHSD